MRDGIYTRRGWRPLDDETAPAPKRGRGLLFIGAVICLVAIMVANTLGGFAKRRRLKRGNSRG